YKYFKDWVAMVIYPESQPKLVPVQHKLGRYTTQEFLYFTQRGQSPNIYPRVRGRIKDARSNGQKFDRFTGSYHAPPTYLTTAEKLIEESLAKLRNSKVKIAN
ncbi:MAG TPA: hypothetical protein VLF63_03565, partial [Patescibacteria group bacterium]|nr:hypothetical protein [Patescibacteria group bacterium]